MGWTTADSFDVPHLTRHSRPPRRPSRATMRGKVRVTLGGRVKPGHGVELLFGGFEYDRSAEPELTLGFGAQYVDRL